MKAINAILEVELQAGQPYTIVVDGFKVVERLKAEEGIVTDPTGGFV